jgi:glycerol-3-phosphate dehydrogenase
VYPYVSEYLHKDRLARLEKNANHSRLVREALAERPSLAGRMKQALNKDWFVFEVDSSTEDRPYQPATS